MVGKCAVAPNNVLSHLMPKVGQCVPLHLQVVACVPLGLEPDICCAPRAEVLLAFLSKRRWEGVPCHEHEHGVAVDRGGGERECIRPAATAAATAATAAIGGGGGGDGFGAAEVRGE